MSDYDISAIERSIQEPDDPMPRYEDDELEDAGEDNPPCPVCGSTEPDCEPGCSAVPPRSDSL